MPTSDLKSVLLKKLDKKRAESLPLKALCEKPTHVGGSLYHLAHLYHHYPVENKVAARSYKMKKRKKNGLKLVDFFKWISNDVPEFFNGKLIEKLEVNKVLYKISKNNTEKT